MRARHRVASMAEIAPLVRRAARRSSAVLVTRWKPGATRGTTRSAEVAHWARTTGFCGACARRHPSVRCQENRRKRVPMPTGIRGRRGGSGARTRRVARGGGPALRQVHAAGQRHSSAERSASGCGSRRGRNRPDGGRAGRGPRTFHRAGHTADGRLGGTACPDRSNSPRARHLHDRASGVVRRPGCPRAGTPSYDRAHDSAADNQEPGRCCGSRHPRGARSAHHVRWRLRRAADGRSREARVAVQFR